MANTPARLTNNNEPDSPKVQIVESVGEDKSYKYSFTYEKATLYEFKFTRAPTPDASDPCFRCNRRVLPKDHQKIGNLLFHKQCFRCRICGLPLTHKTFHRNNKNDNDYEVYCRTHVGKNIAQIQRGEVAPLGLEGPPPTGGHGKKYVVQRRETNLDDVHFSHSHPQPALSESYSSEEVVGTTGKTALPPTTPTDPRLSPVPRASPRGSPANSMTSVTPRSLNDTSQWTHASPNSSLNDVTVPPSSALAASYANSMRSFSHPTPVLRSFDDFDTSGVFEVQPLLEQRHMEEAERLQRFLAEERQKELKRLDDTIALEKEKAAEELLGSLDQLSLHNSVPRSLVEERERIEDHFRHVREERLRMVSDKMAAEEKARNGKMVERHCLEMLMLIGEKDREADRSCLYDHSMKPPVETPESKKSALYKSPALFEHVDLKAVELAGQDHDNHTELVKALTRDCHSELEKLRAIFRWVVAMDLSKNQVSDITRPQHLDSLVRGVRCGKETYHQLFKKLCSYAGLHCEIILGYSKGAGYKPGMRMEGNAFRNAWTAVFVDGSWRLVNCTWAARHVTGHRDNLPQLFYRYDEFYFLTDPEDYVYQHYPDDPGWQLLDIPLPFSEFLNLPVVKSPFFNYGLRFYSNYGATLTTDTGMVEVRLVTPKILGFGSLLEPVTKSSSEARQYEGRVLLRYVKNEAIFTVALPCAGMFYFTVYVGDYWKAECLESACSFLIHCPSLPGPPSPPYPPVPFFGPTPVMESLGIRADSHVDPLVVCNTDFLDLNLTLERDLKLTHTFQYFDVEDGAIADIDRYVFLRSRSDRGANFLVRCPKEGFYIFSIYAADATTTTSSSSSSSTGTQHQQNLDCAVRYLVICQEPSPGAAQFPKTCARWQRCTLHEPLCGDLLTDKRYVFRLDVPQALEVFVVVGGGGGGEVLYHHLKRKVGCAWEGQVMTGGMTVRSGAGARAGSSGAVVRVVARFQAGKDQSIFPTLLEYRLQEDVETEI
ncbi:hillarin-like [Babylonia areolata]|uniref:hillarin-like n=1 Tax=Babylonia areolata TaxID=304850 RepID=UPI003FD43CAC